MTTTENLQEVVAFWAAYLGCSEIQLVQLAVTTAVQLVADHPPRGGLPQPGAVQQRRPQRLGRGDQQRLELPAGVRTHLDDTGAGDLEHPQLLTPCQVACDTGSDRLLSRPAMRWARPVPAA
jgi:hypothetical protein